MINILKKFFKINSSKLGIKTPISISFSDIYIGKILKISQHPNADKLHLVKVDIGSSNILDIVCGAENIYVDMIVPVAILGAKLSGETIRKAKIRGVESNGMLCSQTELRVGSDNKGIWDLTPYNLRIGDQVEKILNS